MEPVLSLSLSLSLSLFLSLSVVGCGTYGLGTTFFKYQMFMTARLLGARWNSTVLGTNLMRRLKVHAVQDCHPYSSGDIVCRD
jgi:hypothetical protein